MGPKIFKSRLFNNSRQENSKGGSMRKTAVRLLLVTLLLMGASSAQMGPLPPPIPPVSLN
jgi:hypothetical protein